MPGAIDLTGHRYHRLTCVERSHVKNTKVIWKCICDCGNETYVSVRSLRSGNTKSCGCLKNERLKEKGRGVKHGKVGTRLYTIWANMKRRCSLESDGSYYRYGARGIKVCEEWRNDFQKFYEWAINSGYKSNLTIERKDIDKGYSPDNCTWIPRNMQSRNRSTTIYIEIDGVTKSIPEWSKESGVLAQTIWKRYKSGWKGKELIRKVV